MFFSRRARNELEEFINETQPYRKGKENQDNRKEHKMPTNESERLSKKKKDAYEHPKHDENNNIERQTRGVYIADKEIKANQPGFPCQNRHT